MEEKFKYWKANTKRNASSISKIKVSLKYPPNNGEYSEIKVHSKINEILNIFSSLQFTNSSVIVILGQLCLVEIIVRKTPATLKNQPNGTAKMFTVSANKGGTV